jgi:hypothetical protein
MTDHPEDAVRRYQKETRALLARRALGPLSMDDEGEAAEALDDIWRELSPEQQQEIETWFVSTTAGEIIPADIEQLTGNALAERLQWYEDKTRADYSDAETRWSSGTLAVAAANFAATAFLAGEPPYPWQLASAFVAAGLGVAAVLFVVTFGAAGTGYSYDAAHRERTLERDEERSRQFLARRRRRAGKANALRNCGKLVVGLVLFLGILLNVLYITIAPTP